MKRGLLLLTVMMLILILAACSAKGQIVSSSAVPEEITADDEVHETEAVEEPAVDGFDVLGGFWAVGAVYNNNKKIDIRDVSALADLYDSVFLQFNKDGSFTYCNLWIYDGEYTRSKTQDKSFILTRQSITMLKDGEMKTEEYTGEAKHILRIIDENTIELSEYDSITGKAKVNEQPLIFVKRNEDSNYVGENKTMTPASMETRTSSEELTRNSKYSSYESILDTYTQKMKTALPELVSAFQYEASGVSDVGQLALICNNKVEKLAEICNGGIEKIAEFMYIQGDDYNVYEKWSGKLMENYMDISMEIHNAYLDSVKYII